MLKDSWMQTVWRKAGIPLLSHISNYIYRYRNPCQFIYSVLALAGDGWLLRYWELWYFLALWWFQGCVYFGDPELHSLGLEETDRDLRRKPKGSFTCVITIILYREAIFKVQNARFTDAVPAKKRLNNGVTRKSLGERWCRCRGLDCSLTSSTHVCSRLYLQFLVRYHDPDFPWQIWGWWCYIPPKGRAYDDPKTSVCHLPRERFLHIV